MSAPFPKKTLISQVSRLSTAMALAVGGMIASLEAAPLTEQSNTPQHAFSVTYADMQQKAKAEQALKAGNEYIACLDGIICLLEKMEKPPQKHGSEEWVEKAAMILQMEDGFDAGLTQMRLSGRAILPETRQARKALGMIRIKLNKIVAEFKRLEGQTRQFESDIDLQAFYALADARNEQIGKRYH